MTTTLSKSKRSNRRSDRFDKGDTEEANKRWYYLGVALAVWVAFQAATFAGIALSAWASENLSLDFVLPLIFIALAHPAIKDRTTGAASLSAGVAAVFCAVLPMNLGLIGLSGCGRRLVRRSRS